MTTTSQIIDRAIAALRTPTRIVADPPGMLASRLVMALEVFTSGSAGPRPGAAPTSMTTLR